MGNSKMGNSEVDRHPHEHASESAFLGELENNKTTVYNLMPNRIYMQHMQLTKGRPSVF